MFRDRQRQEWPNRRLDPQEGRRRVWHKWFYDHMVAAFGDVVNNLRHWPLVPDDFLKDRLVRILVLRTGNKRQGR